MLFRSIVFSAILNPDLNPIWAYIRASPVGMPNEKCKDYLALGAKNHQAFGLVNIRNCKKFYNYATVAQLYF